MTKTFTFGARTASRLAAVQALYQLDIEPSCVKSVIVEFITHRFQENEVSDKIHEPLFRQIVEGVGQELSTLDGLIEPTLSEGWKMDRLEVVIKVILRAATYELLGHTSVPKTVVINEYVNITKAFFSGAEPAFVNACLDTISKQVQA